MLQVVGFLPGFLGLASQDDIENCNDVDQQESYSEDLERINDFRMDDKENYEKTDNEIGGKIMDVGNLVNVTILCMGSVRVAIV